MPVQIDNVGIQLMPDYKPKLTVRTFKARCGSYIRFTVEGRKIHKIEVDTRHDLWAPGQPCIACNTQKESAKILIKSGK